MKSGKQFLTEAWRTMTGVPLITESVALTKLRRTEWCNTFERLMRNRLLTGFYRYGSLHDKNKNYDNVAGARKHLRQYIKTGNTEHLVDVANLMMVEFVQSKHTKKHFQSIDNGIHVQPKMP